MLSASRGTNWLLVESLLWWNIDANTVPTLIIGHNGTGKSSFMEAILFATSGQFSGVGAVRLRVHDARRPSCAHRRCCSSSMDLAGGMLRLTCRIPR